MKAPLNNYKLMALAAVVVLFAMATAPAYAASDNCPAVNAISNFKTTALASASFTGPVFDSSNNSTFTYFLAGNDSNADAGLISYCVYPIQPPGNPDGIAVDASIAGQFQAKEAAEGSFSFTRIHGYDNLPLAPGDDYTMGTATWNHGACTTDPITLVTTCAQVYPSAQTVLLHLSDAAECQALYGGTSSTCWVYPSSLPQGGHPPSCNGAPACKSAVIEEATGEIDADGYPIVPMMTLLHIQYTYVIINQPTNTFNMIFRPPTNKTQDVNSGGGKDYFGCEQIPDPAGNPGGHWNEIVPNYEGTGLNLNFTQSKGNCSQGRFFAQAPASESIVLTPGQSISFTVDMITRVNNGGNQEFTSPGLHLLNSGFTVKWFQSDDDLLHSYSTSVTPIYVDAQ